MNKIIKVVGWLAVVFYIIDIITDFPYILISPEYPLDIFPLWIRILTIVVYQIPLIILLYLAIKQLRGK